MGGFENMFQGGPGGAARAKAKMYGRLADRLEEKRDKLTTRIEETEDELKGSHRSFTSNSNLAQGLLNRTFEEHELNWNGQYIRIINTMQMGIQSISIRITEARQLENYWNQQAQIEEMKAREGF